jgi:MoaA/NifB/PqqE/SkfB family radical SAM enzyme
MKMDEFFKNWQKICIFLTRRCNLRCRGCNVINYNSGYELSTDEWKEAFEILKKYNVGFVVLFGGEPTLREDLDELIRSLNNLHLPHTIITNSIRMMKDERYFEKIMNANPFGISCSVNELDVKNTKYGDEVKTSYGMKLLKKLKNYKYDGDLVANMAITHTNLSNLPEMVNYFSQNNIWSILTFIHLSSPHQSTYWWYRGCLNEDNKELVVREDDREKLEEVADYFLKNYDNLLLHNSKKYFEMWKTPLPIKQNWKCKYWVCPAINPDGNLMACIDRPLSSPFSIFDLDNEERVEELKESFTSSIKYCPGCFWDHMWECNLYAERGEVEYGKHKFSHYKTI